MLAKDIMRRKIITVDSRLTLPELARILKENNISGAPVVGPSGSVVGVVSQTDLVRSRQEPASDVASYHREADGPSLSLGIHFEEPAQTRVEQIMTPGVISFDEETPVEKVAGAMLEKHIHRVLITRGDTLVGIVTTMDTLRALIALSRRKIPARKTARRR